MSVVDAINHNVRLLQSLLPPWPEHFNTFKEAKQWVLVQCVTGRVRFARFQNKTHNQMRGNVIYRTTKHAEDAKLFALLKTEEGAITGPDVDRTTRSNAQNLVILRDGKSIGNKTWDRYEEPRERVRQGNTVHGMFVTLLLHGFKAEIVLRCDRPNTQESARSPEGLRFP
jgi:hypothetical protein